ncbi:hypothetical protein EDD85DRAFT_16035 [Armillaria nabsnona]|nr:hypothetical protein EDD85DRAFT_16035 [Armillaria nabsnona]
MKLIVRSLNADAISRAINMHSSAGGFVVAILGLCTGFLWTAQGLETKRGEIHRDFLVSRQPRQCRRSVCCCWSNLEIHNRSTLLIMGHACIESIILHLSVFSLLANSNKMFCFDGTKVTTCRHPSWKTEITGLCDAED